MDVLVAYDIGDTQGAGAKRLREVHDLCCEYGSRVQFSVFECRLSPARYATLKHQLESLIDAQQDCVHIYHFARPISESKTVLGRSGAHEVDNLWLL